MIKLKRSLIISFVLLASFKIVAQKNYCNQLSQIISSSEINAVRLRVLQHEEFKKVNNLKIELIPIIQFELPASALDSNLSDSLLSFIYKKMPTKNNHYCDFLVFGDGKYFGIYTQFVFYIDCSTASVSRLLAECLLEQNACAAIRFRYKMLDSLFTIGISNDLLEVYDQRRHIGVKPKTSSWQDYITNNFDDFKSMLEFAK